MTRREERKKRRDERKETKRVKSIMVIMAIISLLQWWFSRDTETNTPADSEAVRSVEYDPGQPLTAENYDPAAGSPLAWLMTLAHRRAVDRVRSEQAASTRESRYGAASVEPPSDHVADTVILSDERRQVTECLASLTDTQRECIQLAYYDGLTYAQVSERLSANLATIKSRMRDAIRGLRRCLGAA